MQYSKKLNAEFDIKVDGTAIFKDGTKYSLQEWSGIKGISDKELSAIHLCKKLFKGSIDIHNSTYSPPIEKQKVCDTIPALCKETLNAIFKGETINVRSL